ncbi:MAG: hypothetical protein NC412_01790 [Roseburia sp.]|nr:hypothetical protein [Roseburia sp.]MCM1277989.1 hypothetical protein [Robinsoniella sp.]
MKEKKIFVVGGDKRQYYLAMELWKKGFPITCYGMKQLEERDFIKTPETLELGMIDSDVILLPVPVLQDNLQVKSKEKTILLKELEDQIKKGQMIFGGKIPKGLKEICRKKEAQCLDYMEMEQVALKNAVPTAEGAILEAMKLSNIAIQKSRCLIIGFGKCGEALAEKLSALGAEVTIMARSEEARNKGAFCGYQTRDMFGKESEEEASYKKAKKMDYQFIFNTVPAMVMDKNILRDLLEEKEEEEYPIIIDISSAPGGVDFEYCKEMSVKAGLYLGIPGKYAPKTAGVILSEAVLQQL